MYNIYIYIYIYVHACIISSHLESQFVPRKMGSLVPVVIGIGRLGEPPVGPNLHPSGLYSLYWASRRRAAQFVQRLKVLGYVGV